MSDSDDDPLLAKVRDKLFGPNLEKVGGKLSAKLSLLHTASEATKAATDTRNARRLGKSESLRFWVGLVAPLLAVVVTSATLWIQIKTSAEQRERDQRKELDRQWQDTLGLLYSSDPFKQTAGAFLLKTFLRPLRGDSTPTKDPRYVEDAHQVALHFLNTAAPPPAFRVLFEELCARAGADENRTSNDVDELADMWRGKKRERGQFAALSIGSPPLMGSPPGTPPLTQPQKDYVLNSFDEQLRRVSECIGGIIARNPFERLRIPGVVFEGTDFSTLKAKKLDITDTQFIRCSFKGVDLCGVEGFDKSEWNGTAWWQAARVQERLLTRLRDTFGFTEGTPYYDTGVSTDDYTKDLARLEAVKCPPGESEK